MGVKFTGGGKLLTKLKTISKNAKKARLTAGFYKDAKYEDGTSVAQVAMWNNFGRNEEGCFVPPRPFFSETISKNKDKWVNNYSKALKNTDYHIEKSSKLVGEQMRADIVDSINECTDPPNAEATIKEKGRDAPLKDTYHLMRSVGYQYNDESPQYRSGGN